MSEAKLGVISGNKLHEIDGLSDAEELEETASMEHI